MSTTIEVLSEWFDRGVINKSRFMIVVCDTYDYEDYPVYCSKEDFKEKFMSHNGVNMQRIMEVYDLEEPKEKQMVPGGRFMNFPKELLSNNDSHN